MVVDLFYSSFHLSRRSLEQSDIETLKSEAIPLLHLFHRHNRLLVVKETFKVN